MRTSNTSNRLLVGAALTASLSLVPTEANASVGSVTVNASRPYEGHASYTYAEISLSGTVARADGSVGNYTVPVVVIYPNAAHANNVGVVDWVNSAFYHFFGFPAFEFGTFQFTLLTTDSYLFDEGYTYASVQWNKAVTEIFGPTPPDDGQPHNHLAYGSIERSADAWEIFLDAARLLKNPSIYANGPTAVQTVISSGYSQGGALQLEMLAENLDPTQVYDGHLASMIGLSCWKRDDSPPHYGFLSSCSGVPSGPHAKVFMIVSESDMIAFGGFHSRNPNDPSWRQYELAGVSHLPQSILSVAEIQNPADPSPVFRASFRNLKDWIRNGRTPPAARYLDGTTDSAGNFVPVTDTDGNWTGGLRLPHVQSVLPGRIAGAPLGVHAGLNAAGLDPFHVFVWLGGTFARFSDSDLAGRYTSRKTYVKRVKNAASYLHHQRYITHDDAKAYVDAAEVEPLPFPSNKREVEVAGDDVSVTSGGCSANRTGSGYALLIVGLGLLLARKRRA